MSTHYTIQPVAGAAAELRKLAAGLVYQAFPEFYDLFSCSPESLLGAIQDQFQEPASELGEACVLVGGAGLGGVYAAYPASEMPRRQMVSLKALVGLWGGQGDIWQRVSEFASGVEAIKTPGFYLARIAVSAQLRGAGLGRRLLAELEGRARERGFTASCVHVRSGNEPARRLYQSCGYQPLSAVEAAYKALSKPL